MNTSERPSRNAALGEFPLHETAAAADNGSDARGRFAPGNPGGPGNPFARRVAELRKVLLQAVSEEDLRVVAEQLVVKAKMGDLAATKLLFQYVLGKPAATVDPDAVDVEEVALYRRAPLHGEVTDVVAGRMSAELAADLLRQVVPVTGLRYAETIGAALNHAFAEGEGDFEDADAEVDLEEDEEVASRDAGISGDECQSATPPITNGAVPGRQTERAPVGRWCQSRPFIPAAKPRAAAAGRVVGAAAAIAN